MAEQSYAGRTVVVTGASRGLGLCIARRFAEEGAHVVVGDIDAEAGARAAAELAGGGLAVDFRPLDVREPDQSTALVEHLVKERGQIDVWINNARLVHACAAEMLPRAGWDESITTTLSGTFYCCQAVGRAMLHRGWGVMLNVVSTYGYRAGEERVVECTAMAGLIMLTQSLGVEWAGRGVRVVGLAVGWMTANQPAGDSQDSAAAAEEAYKRRTPMRRLGLFEEAAEAALYLVGEGASYIVGETLRVDGGWVPYQLF